MNREFYSNIEFTDIKERINREIKRRGTYNWFNPLAAPTVGSDKTPPLTSTGPKMIVDDDTYTVNNPSLGSIEPTRNCIYPEQGENPAGIKSDYKSSAPNTSAARFDVDELKNLIIGLAKIQDINLFYGHDEKAGTAFRDPKGIEDALIASENSELNRPLRLSDIAPTRIDIMGPNDVMELYTSLGMTVTTDEDTTGSTLDLSVFTIEHLTERILSVEEALESFDIALPEIVFDITDINKGFARNHDEPYYITYPIEDGEYVMPSGEYDGEEALTKYGLSPYNFFDDYGAQPGDGDYHPYNPFISQRVNRDWLDQDNNRNLNRTRLRPGGKSSQRFGRNPRNPERGDPYPSRAVYGGVVTNCNLACTGLCHTTCDNQCSESCSTSCWGRCGNACTSDCGSSCTGCTNLCYSSCKTKCENSTGYACVKAGALAVKNKIIDGKNNVTVDTYTCISCDYSCQFYPNKKTQCWDNGCMGQCFTSCTTACVISCHGACMTSAAEESASYKTGKGAGCESQCTINCVGICQGICAGQCDHTCYHACQQKCSDNCSWKCSTNCGHGCAKECSSNSDAKTDCDKNCTTSCRYNCTQTCGSDGTDACSANCRMNCTASSCTSMCSDTCSDKCTNCVNTCGWECGLSCSVQCSSTCGADCSADCSAQCTLSCEMNCVNSCSEACGGCSNLCYSCVGMCIGTCSVKCQNGCTNCSNNCTFWCDISCSRQCSINCDNTCHTNCVVSCIGSVSAGTNTTPVGPIDVSQLHSKYGISVSTDIDESPGMDLNNFLIEHLERAILEMESIDEPYDIPLPQTVFDLTDIEQTPSRRKRGSIHDSAQSVDITLGDIDETDPLPFRNPTSDGYIHKIPRNRIEQQESFKIIRPIYQVPKPIEQEPIIKISVDKETRNIVIECPEFLSYIIRSTSLSGGVYNIDEDGNVTINEDMLPESIIENKPNAMKGEGLFIIIFPGDIIPINDEDIGSVLPFGFEQHPIIKGEDGNVYIIIERDQFMYPLEGEIWVEEGN